MDILNNQMVFVVFDCVCSYSGFVGDHVFWHLDDALICYTDPHGLLKWGEVALNFIHLLNRIFPSKPSSYWGSPMIMETPHFWLIYTVTPIFEC